MKKLTLLLIGIIVFSYYKFAQSQQEIDSTLRIIENKIMHALKDLGSEVTVEYPRYNASLIIKYQTRKFMVHKRYKTGRIGLDAYEKIGPSHTGFVLKIHLQQAGTVNQLITPQQIRDTYWQTYFDVTILTATDKQVYWGLSFGSKTDEKLLEKIKKTLNNLGFRPIPIGILRHTILKNLSNLNLSIKHDAKSQRLKFSYRIDDIQIDYQRNIIKVAGDFNLNGKNFKEIQLKHNSNENSYIGQISYEYPSGASVWKIKIDKNDF